MFSTDFIFRQQENLVDNQKSQAGFRPLRNKILLLYGNKKKETDTETEKLIYYDFRRFRDCSNR